MWIAISVVSIVLAMLVVGWRLMVVGRPTPDENDPGRQHEVPGAHSSPPPPTLPD